MREYVQRNRVAKYALGWVLVALVLTSTYSLYNAALKPAFIRGVPSSFYVDFYKHTVADTLIGNIPSLELCRKTPFGAQNIHATRTYIRYENSTNREVLNYTFDAPIDDSIDECTTIALAQQPQVVGSYSVHTEYEFYVDGIRKTGKYDTNVYQIEDSVDSIKHEIELQKKRIDELEQRLLMIQTATSSTPIAGAPKSSPSAQAKSTQTQQPTTATNSGSNPTPSPSKSLEPTSKPTTQPATSPLQQFINSLLP